MGWYKKFHEKKEKVIDAIYSFIDNLITVDISDDPNQTEEEKNHMRRIRAGLLGASGRVTFETKEDQAREAEAKANEKNFNKISRECE